MSDKIKINEAKQIIKDIKSSIQQSISTNFDKLKIFKYLQYSYDACDIIISNTTISEEIEYFNEEKKIIDQLKSNFQKSFLLNYLNRSFYQNIDSYEKKKEKPNTCELYNEMKIENWKENLYSLNKLENDSKFIDPDGFLKLSSTLQSVFNSWKRPNEIFANKNLQLNIYTRPNQLKQTQVGDCSFISSLIILLAYQEKFTCTVFSNQIIFPSFYNPKGMYKVRLFLNGKWREIIIDDLLPVNSYNNLICSQSIVEGDLFIPLVEKAYLKYHNGYDFPGSTSSTDIWRICKWIPEFILLKKADKNKLWEKLINLHKEGFGVTTCGTGDDENEKLGLAESHSYALLESMNIELSNKNVLKMLIIQNPWRKSKINEKYSFKNYERLPERMKNIVKKIKEEEDRGLFLMEFETFCEVFEDLHISWNPLKIFGVQNYNREILKTDKITNYKMNTSYSKLIFLKIKKYIQENNPQFLLYNFKLNQNIKNPIMWILLCHHYENTLNDEESYINYNIFLTFDDSVERLDKSYRPDKMFPLDTIRYTKKGFTLAKIYLNDLIAQYKNENLKIMIILSYHDFRLIETESLINYSLNLYSNVQFDIGEIQVSSNEHEITDMIKKSELEGLSIFDESPQYIIDFFESSQKEVKLTVELIDYDSNELKLIVCYNKKQRNYLNQRIFEEDILSKGNKIEPKEQNVSSKISVYEFAFDNVEKLNLIIIPKSFENKNNFTVKVKSNRNLKFFRIKREEENFPKFLKIKDKITNENILKNKNPHYLLFIEKKCEFMLKSTNYLNLFLYGYPYSYPKESYYQIDLNIDMRNNFVLDCSTGMTEKTLERGIYIIQIEKSLEILKSHGDIFLFYVFFGTNPQIDMKRLI